MDESIGVVVGTGIGGQRNIVKALREKGFSVKGAGNRMWPRDHFVYFNGKYVKNDSPVIGGNAFGEGGKILTGNGFLLVSDMAHLHEPMCKSLLDKPTYNDIKEAIVAEGGKHYPEARIHVAPTGYFHGGKGDNHIDLFSLLLPEKKLLLLDTYYGKGAGNAREYNEIAEKERLRLVRYDSSPDGVWYPLNSLVLSSSNNETVVVDNKAKSLIRILKDEGISVIDVDMPQHSYPAGKIRCQTNTYNLEDNPEDYMAKF